MPVLMLARGDQDSKNLLRHAIEARYGLGPPAMDTLKIEMKGRIRTKVGPVATWMPVEGAACFRFPHTARWNYTMRPVGIALTSGAEACDGTACYRRESHEPVTVIEDTGSVLSLQARLWAIAAVLLVPLAEQFVELRVAGERALEVVNTERGLTAHLHLHDDNTLDFVSTECLNPNTGRTQTYFLRMSEGQAIVDDLMLPRKVSTFWDDQPEMELAPTTVANNPTFDDAFFRLEHD